MLSSWLTARLTGEWVDSTASQVGYLPFDFKRGEWVGRLDWKWQVAPFERSWLPRLVPPTSVLGRLTAAAAIALAEAVSIPVIASGGLASIVDVAALLQPRARKLAGAIAGRALYDGRLDPAEALRLIRSARAST